MPLYSDFKSAKIVKFKNVAISKFENDFGFFRSSHFWFFFTFSPAIRSIFFRVIWLREHFDKLNMNLSRRSLKKDAAAIRAMKNVFVFKTLYLWFAKQ
jgi:hypothetical protein